MTVTSTNSCNPQTASTTYSISVDPLPTASGGNSQTICSNGTATVSGVSSSNGSISWSHNGLGVLSNTTTLTPDYAAAVGDANSVVTLTMTVTSTNSCNPQTASTTYSISVDPLPTASGGNSQTICSNGTATVSGVSSSNGSISWSHNGLGVLSNTTTLTPDYAAAVGDANSVVTLTMTVTSTNSCNPQTASTTYSISVDPLPTASAGSSQTICMSGTATVSGASASFGSILWTENGAGNIINGATSLTPVYQPAIGDEENVIILTMTVTSTNSCSPQTAIATYSVHVFRDISLALLTPLSSINQTNCLYSQMDTIKYSVIGAIATPTLQGLPEGIRSAFNSGEVAIFGSPSGEDGTYIVKLLVQGTCASTSTTFTINVLNPKADFSFTPQIGIAPVSVDFINDSKNAITYEWDFGDGNMSAQDNPNNTYFKEGVYSITLKALGNQTCFDTIVKNIIVYEWQFPNIFTPNGDNVNDLFTLNSNGNVNGILNVKCEVFNRWGNKVYAWEGSGGGWDGHDSTTDLQSAPGTYYFIMTITDINGKTHDKKGFVELRR